MSLGIGTSETDVDTFIQEMKKIADRQAYPKNNIKSIKHQIDEFARDAVRRVYS
jgi:hypothetical protein